MASAMLGGIRRLWPDAHVTWLTDTALVPLVEQFEGVDELLGVDSTALLSGHIVQQSRALLACWATLGLRRWDLGIIAHQDARYRLLTRGARLGRCIVQPPLRTHVRPRPWQWMGQDYLDLLPVPASDRLPQATLSALRPAHPSAGGLDELTAPADIVLAPGGARNARRDDALRRWPLSSWCQLAAALTSRGLTVAVVGGAHDRADAEAIARDVPTVRNLTGQTTLPALMSLLRAARVVVTHDSGTLHLAALTNTPTVALFGPTVPEERVAPGAPVVVATAAMGLPCAPCYDGRDYAVCQLNRCLTGVTVAQVVELVSGQLQHRANPP